MMMDDAKLLRDYVDRIPASTFTELVRRYIGSVLTLSEDTAQRWARRALKKLHFFTSHNGKFLQTF